MKLDRESMIGDGMSASKRECVNHFIQLIKSEYGLIVMNKT